MLTAEQVILDSDILIDLARGDIRAVGFVDGIVS